MPPLPATLTVTDLGLRLVLSALLGPAAAALLIVASLAPLVAIVIVTMRAAKARPHGPERSAPARPATEVPDVAPTAA